MITAAQRPADHGDSAADAVRQAGCQLDIICHDIEVLYLTDIGHHTDRCRSGIDDQRAPRFDKLTDRFRDPLLLFRVVLHFLPESCLS